MTQFGDYIQPKKRRVDRNDQNEVTSYLRGNQPQPRQNENNPRDYDQVKVENGSGYSADPFGVLRIHDATWPERTDQKFVNEGMRNGVESLGVKPSNEWNMVSVLQKSAPDSSFSQGVCSGPTPVFVLFRTRESLDYPFAIPIAEESSELLASPYGLNRIMWHSEPSEDFQECTGEVLQAYVNMGEDGQWVFWKLKSDLGCCGSAVGQLCDECGTVLQPDCPIERTIYAPKGLNLCGCEDSCGTWKQNDVVPAWWFQYLEKWVTIPNFHASFTEKEMEVVTSLNITGGTIRPTENYNTVVTDIIFYPERVTLGGFQQQQINCTGKLKFGNDAVAEGPLTGTVTIGNEQNQVELSITSECNDVTIASASLSSTGNVSLSGTPGAATVTVPLSGVSLDVTARIDEGATAEGTVSVSGDTELHGTCTIDGEDLPNLEVTGTVSVSGEATLNGNVEVGQNAIILSKTNKTVVTGVSSHNAKTFETDQVTFKIPPLSGTIEGTLDDTHKTEVQFSDLTVTLDLSSIFEEFDAVKDDSFWFANCQLHWLTEKAIKLKSGQSLSSISASLSGKIKIPSDVKCNFDFNSSATEKTITGVKNVASATITPTTDTLSIPTTATLDGTKLTISGTGTMETDGTITATAIWPEDTVLTGTASVDGEISASGEVSLDVTGTVSGTADGSSEDTATGTVTFTQPVTVSGPLNLGSGVTLSGSLTRRCSEKAKGVISGVPITSTGNVSLPLKGSIKDERTCSVNIPTQIIWGSQEYPWVEISTESVPFPGIELTGATIQGVTDTITYLACEDCPESEEEEE